MTDRYRAALEDLERLHADGQVTQAQYDLHKAKLLSEATKQRPVGLKITLFVVFVLLLFVLLRVVLALVGVGS